MKGFWKRGHMNIKLAEDGTIIIGKDGEVDIPLRSLEQLEDLIWCIETMIASDKGDAHVEVAYTRKGVYG